MKSENSRKLLDVWKYIFSKYNFFEEYNIDCYMEFGHMTITPEYRHSKIASEFFNFILESFNEWHFNPEKALYIPEHLRFPPPQLGVWFATSKYSQRMVLPNPFAKPLKIYSNRDFVLNGKSFADRIGDQDSVSIIGVTKPYKSD